MVFHDSIRMLDAILGMHCICICSKYEFTLCVRNELEQCVDFPVFIQLFVGIYRIDTYSFIFFTQCIEYFLCPVSALVVDHKYLDIPIALFLKRFYQPLDIVLFVPCRYNDGDKRIVFRLVGFIKASEITYVEDSCKECIYSQNKHSNSIYPQP